jgi:micrococcal nuclease
MKIDRYKLFLIFLIILLIAVNYKTLDGFLVKNFSGQEFIQVERVIDGDTIVVNGSSVRLLGINTPERGEKYYSEAKKFLEEKTFNKTLIIERYGKDKYYRDLAYVFDTDNENINLKIVENGFGNYYFPSGKDKYYESFVEAWEKCIDGNMNLCEKSQDKCANCVIADDFEFGENLILKNKCDYDCDLTGWSVKDEGRKKYVYGNFVLKTLHETEISSEDFNESYVWTKSGDTIFLRDDVGKLVFWKPI